MMDLRNMLSLSIHSLAVHCLRCHHEAVLKWICISQNFNDRRSCGQFRVAVVDKIAGRVAKLPSNIIGKTADFASEFV
jgi:hypothetical protein